MRAEDIRPFELLSRDPKNGFPLMGAVRVLAVGVPPLLRLTKDVVRGLGPDQARKIFMRFGYETGLSMATNLAKMFDWDDEVEWLKAGGIMRNLAGLAREELDELEFDRQGGRLRFTGRWLQSIEVDLGREVLGPEAAGQAACDILAGQASGYASAVWGSEVLVRELTCQVRGDARCTFEGRPVADWGLSAAEMRDYLAFEGVGAEVGRLRQAVDEAERQMREHAQEVARLRRRGRRGVDYEGVVFRSEAMARMLELARKVAPASTTVLLHGETGTGKEVLARFLHRHSGREDQPFLDINCAALPANLLESELFGHVKGAFTGADRDKTGLFVEAGQGTLFLDEVGELPLELQAKLLRALQEREARPVGGVKARPIKARVVAASNRDLKEMVAEGRFREDLYFRLAVIPMHIPPLRKRREDVLPLARHFLARYRPDSPGLSPEAVRLLEAYAWPGNVRELENAMEYAAVLAGDEHIGREHLPLSVLEGPGGPLLGLLEDMPTERQLVERYTDYVLEHTAGNKSQAASILGIGNNTLWRRLKARAEQAHEK